MGAGRGRGVVKGERTTWPNGDTREAFFSECGRYRYLLRHSWEEGGDLVVFIGLNPSTATHRTDDPTLRRCLGFARIFGYGGFAITNLFAFRATEPQDLLSVLEIKGPENHLGMVVSGHPPPSYPKPKTLVACWGAHARGLLGNVGLLRVVEVMQQAQRMGIDLHCLGTTKGGAPRHPLYLPKRVKLEPYRPAVVT